MTIADALAHLPDDAQITVTVRKADLARALAHRGGGPATLTTAEASAKHGYPADRWRRWAEAGRITGAWQDAPGAPWRLPAPACEAHVKVLQSTGRQRRESEPRPAVTPRRHLPPPRPTRSATHAPLTARPPAPVRTGGPTGPRVRRGGAVILTLPGSPSAAAG